ncbi:MAG: Uncharacterised protein [Candidatus Poseidoniaceae archaeon]|nr:MAG: Uncharacterised protein [Candidatus Poseidoniaceae archaeon]
MLAPYVLAMRDSIGTLILIGALATGGAAILILGLGMDTPWAPWERDSNVMFPPVLFTLATFVATVAFCASTVVYHTFLKSVTINADKWWRTSGGVFLLVYGLYSFGSGTFQAAIMLNLLHLSVGLPALILLPRAVGNKQNDTVQI